MKTFLICRVVDGQDYLNRNGFRIFCKVSTKFNEVPIPAPGSMQDDGLTQVIFLVQKCREGEDIRLYITLVPKVL